MKKQPQENAITNGRRTPTLSGDAIRDHCDRFAWAYRFHWGDLHQWTVSQRPRKRYNPGQTEGELWNQDQ
jgi:hypothetical protein